MDDYDNNVVIDQNFCTLLNNGSLHLIIMHTKKNSLDAVCSFVVSFWNNVNYVSNSLEEIACRKLKKYVIVATQYAITSIYDNYNISRL